jgi:hypothetical protein
MGRRVVKELTYYLTHARQGLQAGLSMKEGFKTTRVPERQLTPAADEAGHEAKGPVEEERSE